MVDYEWIFCYPDVSPGAKDESNPFCNEENMKVNNNKIELISIN